MEFDDNKLLRGKSAEPVLNALDAVTAEANKAVKETVHSSLNKLLEKEGKRLTSAEIAAFSNKRTLREQDLLSF